MLVKISYSIMTTGERDPWLNEIREHFKTAKVSYDLNKSGILPAAKKAWDLALEDKEATHICVLQDDMIPINNGKERLEKAVQDYEWAAVSGFQPVSYFSFLDYHSCESEIFIGSGHVWGGTTVLPRYHAERWFSWAEENSKHPLDDGRISEYLIEHNVTAYHVAPTCFDHVGWNDSQINSENNEWRRGFGAKRI